MTEHVQDLYVAKKNNKLAIVEVQKYIDNLTVLRETLERTKKGHDFTVSKFFLLIEVKHF